MRIGFLSACVLSWLLAGSGCSDEKTCTSDLDCVAGQVCGGTDSGPYHCLKDCTMDGICPRSLGCEAVSTPVCFTCDFVMRRGCVLAPSPSPH